MRIEQSRARYEVDGPDGANATLNLIKICCLDRSLERLVVSNACAKNCALTDCVNGQGASSGHVSTRGR